ncbi:MAG: glycopeptide antibiotics resistance protein [Shewanella sp.]|jgi:glycopeptide antibiotics resistance protein
MVFWLMGLIIPNANIKLVVICALAFSFSIEFSQLYHAAWIDEIRSYKLAALVLGFGFQTSDLICYTVGVLFGALTETMLINKGRGISKGTSGTSLL